MRIELSLGRNATSAVDGIKKKAQQGVKLADEILRLDDISSEEGQASLKQLVPTYLALRDFKRENTYISNIEKTVEAEVTRDISCEKLTDLLEKFILAYKIKFNRPPNGLERFTKRLTFKYFEVSELRELIKAREQEVNSEIQVAENSETKLETKTEATADIKKLYQDILVELDNMEDNPQFISALSDVRRGSDNPPWSKPPLMDRPALANFRQRTPAHIIKKIKQLEENIKTKVDSSDEKAWQEVIKQEAPKKAMTEKVVNVLIEFLKNKDMVALYLASFFKLPNTNVRVADLKSAAKQNVPVAQAFASNMDILVARFPGHDFSRVGDEHAQLFYEIHGTIEDFQARNVNLVECYANVVSVDEKLFSSEKGFSVDGLDASVANYFGADEKAAEVDKTRPIWKVVSPGVKELTYYVQGEELIHTIKLRSTCQQEYFEGRGGIYHVVKFKNNEKVFKFSVIHNKTFDSNPIQMTDQQAEDAYDFLKRYLNNPTDNRLLIHCVEGVGRAGCSALIKVIFLHVAFGFFPDFPLNKMDEQVSWMRKNIKERLIGSKIQVAGAQTAAAKLLAVHAKRLEKNDAIKISNDFFPAKEQSEKELQKNRLSMGMAVLIFAALYESFNTKTLPNAILNGLALALPVAASYRTYHAVYDNQMATVQSWHLTTSEKLLNALGFASYCASLLIRFTSPNELLNVAYPLVATLAVTLGGYSGYRAVTQMLIFNNQPRDRKQLCTDHFREHIQFHF